MDWRLATPAPLAKARALRRSTPARLPPAGYLRLCAGGFRRRLEPGLMGSALLRFDPFRLDPRQRAAHGGR
jgi:hypothetical protein